MVLPLEGVKVLDLAHLPPGSYCTMFLGDMGAEVIKVLPPEMPFTTASLLKVEEERWSAFDALNRNKKGLVLNLRAEEGRRIFYKLAQKADVIVEGFRPGVVKRLGVDYETIKEINLRIVYCSLSGYGQNGPYSQFPGHDANYLSIGGVLGVIGTAEGEPVLPSNLIADFAGAGLHGVIGILLALMAREKTGRGQFIDLAYLDGVLSLMSYELSKYFASGVMPERGKGPLTGGAPYYNVYETKDGGYISLGCIEPHFWANLCRELGREDLIPYQHSEGEKKEEIFSFLRQVFRQKTRDEWFELLKEKNIPIAPVYSLAEVFSDPQVLHRQIAAELNHPTIGKVKQVGVAIRLSDTPGKIKSFAPLPGEHTDEILQDLGYSAEEIEKLRKEGVIK